MNMITRSGVLLLWSQLMTFVTCQDCTLEQFKKSRHYDLNFDISGLDATYSGGKQVIVPCAVGYTGFFEMICSEGTWLSSSPKCELKSCGLPEDAQFADFRLEIGDDYVFGSQIVYECNSGYHMVSRSSRRRCLSDGWDGNIPVCEVNSCEIGGLDPNLYLSVLTPTCGTMEPGHKLRFLCGPDYQLDGSMEIECLPTGEWSASFPSCSAIRCSVPHIEHGRVLSAAQEYKEQEILDFTCDPFYKRATEITPRCTKIAGKADWSPTPACKPPLGCSAPPALEDGDTKLIIRSDSEYQHGDRVEYICQDMYIMDGDPFKTCDNGVWKGVMRCLKPCTVNQDLMHQHGIIFRLVSDNKVYAPHEGHITFLCERGKRRVGTVPLRVQCNDGQMNLPTCQ